MRIEYDRCPALPAPFGQLVHPRPAIRVPMVKKGRLGALPHQLVSKRVQSPDDRVRLMLVGPHENPHRTTHKNSHTSRSP